MHLNIKIVAGFKRLGNLQKTPLLNNNFNKLFLYILHYLFKKSKHTIECWW